MKRFLGLVVMSWLVLVLPMLAAGEFREFTDTSGRKVRAELVQVEGDRVTLRTADGRSSVKLGKLSAADQEYVRLHAGEINKAAGKTLDDAVAAIDEAVVLGIMQGSEALKTAYFKDAAWRSQNGQPVQPFVPLMPNPPLTEEQFVRRAYLDIVGRIPTAAEVSAFLDDASASKRARLIDQLLASDAAASHLYNYLADMLRIKPETEYAEVRMMTHGDWLKRHLQQNQPYDQIVRDIITAKGKPWDGAAGFYLRDIGMPMKHLTYTMWAFAGTDLSCAECHDHPFNDWTQRQFYEMAAFFSGVRAGQPNSLAWTRANTLLEEAAQLAASLGGADPRNVRYRVWQLINANKWSVWDEPARRLHLPSDYKYRDGNPGELVVPKLIRWSEDDFNNAAWKEAEGFPQADDSAARRKIFANWLTHPDNPRFAMAIAHRLWTRAFGPTLTAGYSYGHLVLRNIGDPSESSNPELLEQLTREMVRVKFDLRAFLRTIYNTQAWQRAATTDDVTRGHPYYFQGPMLRRMSAEQVWDSVVTLAAGGAPPSNDSANNDLKARATNLDLENPKLDAKTLLMKVAAVQSVEARARAGRSSPNAPPIKVYGGLMLVRASDLAQPAPADHALRTFGQSERELMDSNTTEGSVPQVLALMHGKISSMVTNPDSHVMRTKAEGMEGVKSIYLSVLGRNPTEKERARAEKHLQEMGEGGWADLVWALLNSREFLFVQ